jgi:phage shock protein A
MLFERISLLIRSNLKELTGRTEDPQKKLKQLIRDMEKELRELKSEVAVSITDQCLLEQKLAEHRQNMAEWMRKAELFLDTGEDASARSALDRYVSSRHLAVEAEGQVYEQKDAVDALKSLLARLERKLEETKSEGEILIARDRRSHLLDKAMKSSAAAEGSLEDLDLDQLGQKVEFDALVSRARIQIAQDMEAKLEKIEKDGEIDSLLEELKHKRSRKG